MIHNALFFFGCEVTDLTDQAMQVSWQHTTPFWVRKADLDDRNEIHHICDRGTLWLRDNFDNHTAVNERLADMMPGREEEQWN